MYSYEELLLLGLMNKQPIIENKKIAVLGGGSWGTALVKMLSENLSKIGWYIRNSQTIEYIKTNKHNPNYLTSTELHPESLDLSNDINKIIKELIKISQESGRKYINVASAFFEENKSWNKKK